ncbi:FlgD immunoglobulin-like domain containing protein [Xanthobacteraceae bacterium Astr-EGSB]|uniref:flagellar hook assembly protein FlgD n=1 Tax=Astrobacterium formosum TaxID=3069710 RepID=UPI0027B789DA|nr:FlgD immunoglobulin-like domain containing protein [Xanthobacteraceae bacterium Astr-EGSB]
MSVSTVSPSVYTNTSSSANSSSSSNTSSSSGTTDFLELMIAQLQNQNPLDPTDTNEFVNQLISYEQISQTEAMNESLSSMLTSFNSLISTNAVGYLGHTVEAYGDTASLEDGQATWGYSLNDEAADVTITVKDSDGNTVWEGSGETEAGKHTFTWDGKSTDGTQLADGEYTVEIEATDADGESVYGYTTVIGEVDGVDSSSGETLLTIGGVSVALDDVIGVRA